MFLQAEIGIAPATEEENAKQLLFLNCRWQVSVVTMSHPSLKTVAKPPCLPLGIKDSLKEDTGEMLMLLMAGVCLSASCTEDSTVQVRGFLGWEVFGFWAFAFGFLEGEGFLMWEALEGKRIAEGRIAEGKRITEGELLKGNC
jgi:hypothetical protein